MNTLQSLHGHLSGFHFLIFLRKIGSVAQSLMLEGTKFQILGPVMTTSQYHITQFLHYMSENLRLDVDYMEHWLH